MKHNPNNIRNILFLAVLLLVSSALMGQETASMTNDLFWRPLLEQSFMRTFSSSHEFAASQIFQRLGYDLAEISQIKKLTPYPASITISFDSLIESEAFISSETRKILKLENLSIKCEKVHYFGMVMEQLTFDFADCSLERDYLQRGKVRFYDTSSINLRVKVSEQDILSVMKLYSKASALSSVKVTLSSNKVRCRGRVKMGFLVAEFDLRGYTKLISPKKVNLICEKLFVNGILQPRAFVNPIMNYVNPVFDSSKIWVNLNVKSMELKKGFVETLATIDKKEIKNAN